jgi:hypothetical protein
MTKNYALAVCTLLAILGPFCVGMFAFSMVRYIAPTLIVSSSPSPWPGITPTTKRTISFVNTTEPGQQSPDEAAEAAQSMSAMAQLAEQIKVNAELLDAKRGLLLWGILATISAALWLMHWRLLVER